jgi:hypothetical protein
MLLHAGRQNAGCPAGVMLPANIGSGQALLSFFRHTAPGTPSSKASGAGTYKIYNRHFSPVFPR